MSNSELIARVELGLRCDCRESPIITCGRHGDDWSRDLHSLVEALKSAETQLAAATPTRTARERLTDVLSDHADLNDPTGTSIKLDVALAAVIAEFPELCHETTQPAEVVLEWNMSKALTIPSKDFSTLRDAFIVHGHNPDLFDAATHGVVAGEGKFAKPPRLLIRVGGTHWKETTLEELTREAHTDAPPAADDVRTQVEAVLRGAGLSDKPEEFDSDMHSWRCQLPERYGRCDCFGELATELSVVLDAARQPPDTGSPAF